MLHDRKHTQLSPKHPRQKLKAMLKHLKKVQSLVKGMLKNEMHIQPAEAVNETAK
jgi:hypothetical protein